jgi:hypothetical protein
MDVLKATPNPAVQVNANNPADMESGLKVEARSDAFGSGQDGHVEDVSACVG